MSNPHYLAKVFRTIAATAFVIIGGAFCFSVNTPHALAALGDGATSAIHLLDSGEDGKPDTITFSIANPNGESWAAVGSSPYGVSVTQNGAAITVTGVTRTSGATANPITISVALDTSDSDLQYNTDGVVLYPIELIYTRVGGGVACTNCLRDNVDEEMNAIATGDTNATNTEVDLMKPVVMTMYENAAYTRNLTFNTVDIEYSERMHLSLDNDGGTDVSYDGTATGTSTATAGSMTVARTIAGFGTWAALNGGDMAISTVGGNEIIAYQNAFIIVMNEVDSSYFSAGSTAPTTPVFTPSYSPLTVFDAAGNGVSTNTKTMFENVPWDVTAPTLDNTYSCYSTVNGKVNRVQLSFNENIDDYTFDTSVFEVDNDSTNNGIGEETPVSFNTATAGCDGTADDTDYDDEKIRLDLTTGITGTDKAYVHYAANGSYHIRDGAGNLMLAGSALGTENDRAAPIVMSTTPTAGSNILNTSPIVLNFSEAMDSTAGHFVYTFPGEPTLTPVWTSGDTVLTLNGTKIHGSKTLTVTAGPDAAAQAFGTFLATSNASFSFTVLGGSNTTATPAVITYALTLTSPTASFSYQAGTNIPITWTSNQTNSTAMTAINLAYSTDSGLTFTTIANNEVNDGSYTWTAPNISSNNVTLKITGTDLVTTLATNTGAAFTISSSASTPNSDTTVPVAPTLAAGSFVKSSANSAVYYITADGHRLPFINEQVYATYASDFSSVATLTDIDLSAYPLGAPVAPKPGTVLVKIQSTANTYAVTGTPEASVLRLITSEELAASLYGSNWADYVIDLPPTMWPHLTIGTQLANTSDLIVDRSTLLRRVDLFLTILS